MALFYINLSAYSTIGEIVTENGATGILTGLSDGDYFLTIQGDILQFESIDSTTGVIKVKNYLRKNLFKVELANKAHAEVVPICSSLTALYNSSKIKSYSEIVGGTDTKEAISKAATSVSVKELSRDKK